jgi:hypothetical protein
MVSNNFKIDRLEVMPAYYWMYNLYALERNSRKSLDRDRRKNKVQHIEMDYLASDTAEEIISAAGQIRGWLADAGYSADTKPSLGPREIPAPGLERNDRGTVILKPCEALTAYNEMLRYYAVKTILAFLGLHADLDFKGLADLLEKTSASNPTAGRVTQWENMGGQIVPAFRVDALRKDIREGKTADWDAIHAVYNDWHTHYAADKAAHAWAVLWHSDAGKQTPDKTALIQEIESAVKIKRTLADQVYETRAKDFTDPYRLITFRSRDEMEMVAGKPENAFVEYAREDLVSFEKIAENITKRL